MSFVSQSGCKVNTRRFRKLTHSLYECKYHVVFCSKYRYKILQAEVSKFVEQQILKLCDQKEGVEVLELNVQADHVHLVVVIPPKYMDMRDFDEGLAPVQEYR